MDLTDCRPLKEPKNFLAKIGSYLDASRWRMKSELALSGLDHFPPRLKRKKRNEFSKKPCLSH